MELVYITNPERSSGQYLSFAHESNEGFTIDLNHARLYTPEEARVIYNATKGASVPVYKSFAERMFRMVVPASAVSEEESLNSKGELYCIQVLDDKESEYLCFEGAQGKTIEYDDVMLILKGMVGSYRMLSDRPFKIWPSSYIGSKVISILRKDLLHDGNSIAIPDFAQSPHAAYA